MIIADGLKGTDEVLVPVKGEYVKEAKIGQAIMDADIIISLNHFKGHESTGFGGAIKNLGMGCGSRAGKMEHARRRQARGGPEPVRRLRLLPEELRPRRHHHHADNKARIDHDKCVGCGRCIGACPMDATHAGADNSQRDPQLQNGGVRPGGGAGPASVPHQPGAGYQPLLRLPRLRTTRPSCRISACSPPADAVAIDQACADACLRAEPIPGTRLSEMPHISDDHFTNSYPVSESAQPALPRGKDRPGSAGL